MCSAVTSSPTNIAFSIRLCQFTTFHESRFSWDYAPHSGVRTEHLSAHPSYARSPNHVSFSCWQITVHKPESQRMRALEQAMTARRGSKLRRGGDSLTCDCAAVLGGGFGDKIPATIEHTLIQHIIITSCLLTLRSAQDPISWPSSRTDAPES